MRTTHVPPLSFTRRLLVSLALALAFGVTACQSCRTTPRPDATQPASPDAEGPPALRLYALSDLAGALEPCGCTQDQLGGIDHLAAFVASDRTSAKGSLLVLAGPTAFLDPQLDPARRTQDLWKGEAISSALGDVGLAAWTPGANDWAAGPATLGELAKKTNASLVAANVTYANSSAAPGGFVKSVVRDVAGLKVGIAGVTAPKVDGVAPAQVVIADPLPAMKSALADLKAQGAQVLVGLAALPRGEALRLAEALPELSVLVVGKPVDAGDANDAPAPPMLAGTTLVVQTSNHLQTVGVVDFYIRGNDTKFQDATGVANAEALLSLDKRTSDLEKRLAAWEHDPQVRPEDIAARRADLTKLRAEKERLSHPPSPQTGSFFRYKLVEVRKKLGSDSQVSGRMADFYHRVNDHNRTAFAGRKPPVVPPGASGYAGVEVCSSCHEEARKVWDRTQHAQAFGTLSHQFKEFNLDCVSCHVTGYEKPGGSTVTLNASLQNVQCESCHGPGQRHAQAPDQKGLILRAPKEGACAASCHHPPHVDAFDESKAKERIVGPGHGMSIGAPWPAWAKDGG